MDVLSRARRAGRFGRWAAKWRIDCLSRVTDLGAVLNRGSTLRSRAASPSSPYPLAVMPFSPKIFPAGPPSRAFEIDVLACPRCGSRMQVIATIDDSAVAGRRGLQ